MPTNKELEKQLKEVRQELNHLKKKSQIKQRPFKLAPRTIIEGVIALAAVVIAYMQFSVADKQNDISEQQTALTETQTRLAEEQTKLTKKQTDYNEFQIIRALSEVDPNDSISLQNVFDYLPLLDTSAQVRFLRNSSERQNYDYLTFLTAVYLKERLNVEPDWLFRNYYDRLSDSRKLINYIKSLRGIEFYGMSVENLGLELNRIELIIKILEIRPNPEKEKYFRGYKRWRLSPEFDKSFPDASNIDELVRDVYIFDSMKSERILNSTGWRMSQKLGRTIVSLIETRYPTYIDHESYGTIKFDYTFEKVYRKLIQNSESYQELNSYMPLQVPLTKWLVPFAEYRYSEDGFEQEYESEKAVNDRINAISPQQLDSLRRVLNQRDTLVFNKKSFLNN